MPRLLIMDDNPDIAEILAAVGEKMGCDVQATSRAGDFREAVRSFAPDAILLDLVMPDTDGIELLRFLADSQVRAAIVLVSGSDRKIIEAAGRLGEALDLRMAGALQKPLTLPDVEAVLNRVFGISPPVSFEELRYGIERNDISPYFQPKVSVNNGRARVIGAEALARWNHPTRGLLGPVEFIAPAQQFGLIPDLTWSMFAAIARELVVCQGKGWNLSMSLNVSADMLNDSTLPDRLAEAADSMGISPSSVMLELTESAAVADLAQSIEILTRFRIKGFGLSMDDYGTGYSSLTQLVRLPFNELKIDRSFVNDIGRHRASELVIVSTIVLAHRLDMTVCAEGVETPEQLVFLRQHGADAIQGFLIRRPLPPDEWQAFIERPGNSVTLPN
jgi:EAL domain-containing protein (putative c-di-GMP-specific phosphodiesterase class I)